MLFDLYLISGFKLNTESKGCFYLIITNISHQKMHDLRSASNLAAFYSGKSVLQTPNHYVRALILQSETQTHSNGQLWTSAKEPKLVLGLDLRRVNKTQSTPKPNIDTHPTAYDLCARRNRSSSRGSTIGKNRSITCRYKFRLPAHPD